MLGVVGAIRQLGGVASVGQLQRAGFSEHVVRALCRAGKIKRVRRGWYAALETNEMVVRATRVGGSLTCISGCAARGVWQPQGSILHVSVPVASRHLKDPTTGEPIERSNTSVEIHWSGRHGASTSFRPGPLPIVECLIEVLHCQPEDLAFAIVESALHLGLITANQTADLARIVPSRSRLLELASTLSGSGTESLFRYRRRELVREMKQQAEIPGVGLVDFLIGDRLIVEIDSETHHGSPNQRRRDLERDAVASALDFETLRFDYVSVMFDWPFVESTVDAVIARGGHLRS